MRKGLKILMVVGVLSMASTMTSMAGWEQVGTQWKYQNTDGSYIMNQWVWLDGDNNGVEECYYLDANGVMAVNTVVDGYTVNVDGQWTVNGAVQTKVVSEAGGQTSANNSSFTVPSLSIGNVDSGSWEAECGDSTGLPPMQSGTGNNNQSDNNDISWGDPNETGGTDAGWGVEGVIVG